MRIETKTIYIADNGAEFDNETDCRNYEDDVSTAPVWIVNELGELGVRVNGENFYLYKGENYNPKAHEDGRPMRWRRVGKREFGECCHPLHFITDGFKAIGEQKRKEYLDTYNMQFDWRDP